MTSAPLKLIYLAFIGGQVLFAIVILFVLNDTSARHNDSNNPLLYAGAAITLATIVTAYLIYNRRMADFDSAEDKTAYQRSSQLMRWALIEAGNLINLVFLFTENNLYFLLPFAIGLGVFFMTRPETENSDGL